MFRADLKITFKSRPPNYLLNNPAVCCSDTLSSHNSSLAECYEGMRRSPLHPFLGVEHRLPHSNHKVPYSLLLNLSPPFPNIRKKRRDPVYTAITRRDLKKTCFTAKNKKQAAYCIAQHSRGRDS